MALKHGMVASFLPKLSSVQVRWPQTLPARE